MAFITELMHSHFMKTASNPDKLQRLYQELRRKELEGSMATTTRRRRTAPVEVGERRKELSANEKKEQERVESLLDTLAQLGGEGQKEEDIVFKGKKIILPEDQDLSQAIKYLEKAYDDQEQVYTFTKEYRYRPLDGAYAAFRAIKRAFGIMTQVPTPSFWGQIPPEMRTIEVDFGVTDQVPQGRFSVPHMEDAFFQIGEKRSREFGPVFLLQGQAKRKYRNHIDGLFKLIEEELQNNSMYRGKAITASTEPSFQDPSGKIDRDLVVYSKDIEADLRAHIWGIVWYARQREQYRMPIKHAVLLTGVYGSGKTLAAQLTMQEATAAGWTFITARPGQDDLLTAMQTARLYQPCVVMYEDVENAASTASSPTAIQQILEIFDGIQAKNTQIITILTTNKLSQVPKGMFRPGRIDKVIVFGGLDRPGVETLTTRLLKDKLADEVDFDAFYEETKQFSPAWVRAAIDNSLQYALVENKGELKGIVIGTDELVHAARNLRHQYEIMEGAAEGGKVETLESAFTPMMDRAARDMLVQHMDPNLLNTKGQERLTEIMSAPGYQG